MFWVNNVWYEERLGRDFDHKEVTVKLGGFPKKRNENIYRSTVNDVRAKYVGKCAMYDILNEHLGEPVANIRTVVGEIEQKVKQINTIYNVNEGILGDEIYHEIEGKEIEIEELIGELPGVDDLLERNFSCDFRKLYEVLIMGIKNRLLGIQVNNKNRENREKRMLQEMKNMYEEMDGKKF